MAFGENPACWPLDAGICAHLLQRRLGDVFSCRLVRSSQVWRCVIHLSGQDADF